MQKAQPNADVENRMAESIIVLLRPMLSLNIPEKRTPTIDQINAHPTYHPCCKVSN